MTAQALPHQFVPHRIYWELTRGCNLRCLHCRARAYGMTGDYLAEEPFCIHQPSRRQATGHMKGGAPCRDPF